MIQRCVAWCSRHSLARHHLGRGAGDMGRTCATSIGGGRCTRSVGSPGWSGRRVDGPSGKRGRDAGDARSDRIAQVGTGRQLRPWRLDVGNGVRGCPVWLVEELGAGAARDPSPRRRPQDVMPSTIRVEVGPPASSTGWIYEYALVGSSRLPLAVGHRLQDELLRNELMKIPGVAEVASVGGTTEQIARGN